MSDAELTPEQKQAMITSAGISAGQGTAAATGAADRAIAAAGGNPLAAATYRARAALTAFFGCHAAGPNRLQTSGGALFPGIL